MEATKVLKVIDACEAFTNTPLFEKEGLGEILQTISSIPLNPPFIKGELLTSRSQRLKTHRRA